MRPVQMPDVDAGLAHSCHGASSVTKRFEGGMAKEAPNESRKFVLTYR